MPIRFRCHRCDQLLAIARRKAGMETQCPKCHERLLVPGEPIKPVLEAAVATGPAAQLLEQSDFDKLIGTAERRPRRTEPDSPLPAAQFLEAVEPPVIAQEARRSPEPIEPELVTATEPELELPQVVEEPVKQVAAPVVLPLPVRRDRPPVEPRRIPPPDDSGTLSNSIIWLAVGLLLGFCLGIGVGRYVLPARSTSPVAKTAKPAIPAEAAREDAPPPEPAKAAPATQEAGGTKPKITGLVSLKEGGNTKPDEGACVLVFPANQQPRERIVTLGLRPDDRYLQLRPGVDQLQRFSGKFAYTDAKGEFAIEIDEPGLYWVLILSKHAKRDPKQGIFVDEQAILRKYFASIDELLGSGDYLLINRDASNEKVQPVKQTFGG